MSGGFPVVLDACVLVPMPLADLLLRLAAGPALYLPKWTDQIMTEVSQTLQESFGLTPEKAQYREGELRRYFPEAWVEGYEDLIPAMTNHEKDRHVLAAAVIVIYNLRDFPDFIACALFDHRPRTVVVSHEPARHGSTRSDADLGRTSRSDRATSVIPAFEASYQRTGFRCNNRIEARRT